jgi:hypothetical protein
MAAMTFFQIHGWIIADDPSPVHLKMTLSKIGQSMRLQSRQRLEFGPIIECKLCQLHNRMNTQTQKSPPKKWALGESDQV